MTIKKLEIQGMSCQHCVMALQKELQKVESVGIQSISVGNAVLQIDETKVTDQVLKNAVEKAGYTLVKIH